MIRFLKRLRDDALLWRYVANVPESFAAFLDAQHHLRGKNIALVVAFEQPWILDIMLRKFKQNVTDFEVIVFDNSRNSGSRERIAQVCRDASVPYFGLPCNVVRHPNRSHGRAMTWIYHNFVVNIQPAWFGFLDHDLIAMKPIAYQDRLDACLCFGKRMWGRESYWYLWAGYCFFRYNPAVSKQVNFLNDFPRDLDTGGRNWRPIYEKIQGNQLMEVPLRNVFVTIPGDKDFLMEMIDSVWLHISAVGHSDVAQRTIFYDALNEAFRTNDFSSENFCLKAQDTQQKIFE